EVIVGGSFGPVIALHAQPHPAVDRDRWSGGKPLASFRAERDSRALARAIHARARLERNDVQGEELWCKAVRDPDLAQGIDGDVALAHLEVEVWWPGSRAPGAAEHLALLHRKPARRRREIHPVAAERVLHRFHLARELGT